MPALKPMNRILSMLLVLTLFIGLLPSMVLRVRAEGETHTFTNGAIYLDENYSGDTVYILGDVDLDQDGEIDDDGDIFSVTVNGAQNVTIIFNNVTMDRRAGSDTMSGQTVEGLYNVSDQLEWGTVAQTCPFLITGTSSVNAYFHGKCTFYAGTNNSTVNASSVYTAAAGGAGFAAIQVDAKASLTIEYATDLTVYGAHQLAEPDENGEVTNGTTTAKYSDVLRANADIKTTEYIYNDPYDNLTYKPANASVGTNVKSGGAGIGGGAAYDTSVSDLTDYTAGTPGTIIINGGTIEAFGGHQAAGIGGGVNSAATTSMIQINGGTVTAHGGRWSAGIGDGDSIADKTSTMYAETSSLIEINGGTVTAYGGVASPGIGCSDQVTSKMKIAVNGGAVTAFSGFPSGFSGAYGTVAPAAIGAGSGSTMDALSVYISSAATLTCAGFGNYALTEDGTNASSVPNISVDSDGYLLLLRTDKYYSSATRTLKLYLPQTQIITDADGYERECYIYVEQASGTRYYVDKKAYDTNKDFLIFNEDGEQLTTDQTEDLKLTLYVDGNSVEVDQIELAYYFRSIALTLTHPEQYGGLYALTVPVDGVPDSAGDLPDEHIILTVEAHEQGTQSGVVTYPADGNLTNEKTADPLTELDAYEGDVTPSGNGLIGDDFYPRVYSYTVYVESDCEKATLYAAFDDAGGTNYYELFLNNSTDSVAATDHGDYRDLTLTVPLTGEKTTVRLKKRDNGSNLGAITYEITFIKKGEYNLNLTDPSKVYDGTPVSVSASGVYSGSLYTVQNVPAVDFQAGTASLSATSLSSSSTFYLGKSGSTNYRINIGMTLSVQTTNQPNVLNYILQFDISSKSGTFSSITTPVRMGWTVEYDEESGAIKETSRLKDDPETVAGATWVKVTDCMIASKDDYTAYLYSTKEGQVQVYRSSYNTMYTLFKLDTASLVSNDTTGGGKTKAEAEAEALAALEAGATTGSFPYNVNTEYVWTQKLTIGTVTAYKNGGNYTNSPSEGSRSITNTYTTTGSGAYELVAGGDSYTPIAATQEELNSARFTWYRVEENGTETLLAGPPAEAGDYRVEAVVNAATYNAAGSRLFTISTRPVTVLQVENWLIYLTGAQVAELELAGEHTLAIADPGAITLYNVISGDDVALTEWDSLYYNSIGVTYSSDKISIRNPVLTGEDAHNYHIVYTYEDVKDVRVFGQIAYSTNGTIFRKTEDGLWLKFYPVDAADPVTEDSDDLDYHSPAEDDTTHGVYLSHAEYVKARTVNESGAARYAVDLEYGAMQFTYYFSTWDVNNLQYDETEGSYWSGFDGVNNKLTVTNYANRPVQFCLSAYILPQYSDYLGNGTGITAAITANANGSGGVDSSAWTEIAQAAAGNSTQTGSSVSVERWLILTGVPQVSESASYTTVGSITLTVAPADDSS